MQSKIREYLKRYPWSVRARKHIVRADWWLRDVRSAYLSRSTTLATTPYGFKLLGSNSIHHLAMQAGTFEPEETALFKALFQQADIFVDVGANIGFYACHARHAGLHVVAVEPLFKNLEYLYENLRANAWADVEVFPLGLGARPGVATLFGGSSTGASLIGSWAGASQRFRKTIPISTLDILLGNRFSGQNIFIKMDVEGAEYPALLGAVTVMDMEPKPVWVVEICLNEYHPNGINPDFRDTFILFWQHGYQARTADQFDKVIQPADVERWVKNGRCDSGTINYRFAPEK